MQCVAEEQHTDLAVVISSQPAAGIPAEDSPSEPGASPEGRPTGLEPRFVEDVSPRVEQVRKIVCWFDGGRIRGDVFPGSRCVHSTFSVFESMSGSAGECLAQPSLEVGSDFLVPKRELDVGFKVLQLVAGVEATPVIDDGHYATV